jgi:hypothetical protein
MRPARDVEKQENPSLSYLVVAVEMAVAIAVAVAF